MVKILVVEDDPFLGRAYHTILTKEGFDVELAADGAQGLKKAESHQPDLILLDMLMPQLTGSEFLRAYKQPEKHPAVKIIVFSNMSVPEQVDEARALGALKYLTKASMSPKEMVGVIKEVLASPGQSPTATA